MPPISTRWSDTTPEMLDMFLELHRNMTATQKLSRVFELKDLLLQLSLADVRRCYPQASETEVFLRMAARRLPRDLMLRVYGWHPDLDTKP